MFGYQNPERTPLPNNYRLPSSTPIQSKPSGINLTKPRNEITITPVNMSNPAIHQTILQQQLQRQQDSAAARMKFPMMVGWFSLRQLLHCVMG